MSMWLYLPFGALLAGSLVGIVVIASRKFPQLTLIDTESLPQERDRKRKKEIVAQRVHRMAHAKWKRTAEAFAVPLVSVRDSFRRQFKKLQTLDRQFRNERLLKKGDSRAAIVEKLVGQAEKLREKGKYGEAEKKYIEALSVDERSREAYIGLGELCMLRKRYHRARETFAFLARMSVKAACGQTVADMKGVPMPRHEAFAESCKASSSDHAEVAERYLELSTACQADGDTVAARMAIKTAVMFEPSTPRYLDLLVEACILEGDQERAYEALAELREANPENAKVEVYGERIAALDRE